MKENLKKEQQVLKEEIEDLSRDIKDKVTELNRLLGRLDMFVKKYLAVRRFLKEFYNEDSEKIKSVEVVKKGLIFEVNEVEM